MNSLGRATASAPAAQNVRHTASAAPRSVLVFTAELVQK